MSKALSKSEMQTAQDKLAAKAPQESAWGNGGGGYGGNGELHYKHRMIDVFYHEPSLLPYSFYFYTLFRPLYITCL